MYSVRDRSGGGNMVAWQREGRRTKDGGKKGGWREVNKLTILCFSAAHRNVEIAGPTTHIENVMFSDNVICCTFNIWKNKM